MKYNLIVRDKAIAELENAYQWYERQRKGLGEIFLDTVRKCNREISEHPGTFKVTYRKFREAWLKKFPFVVVYFIDEAGRRIVIVSVFHTSRNPKEKFS